MFWNFSWWIIVRPNSEIPCDSFMRPHNMAWSVSFHYHRDPTTSPRVYRNPFSTPRGWGISRVEDTVAALMEFLCLSQRGESELKMEMKPNGKWAGMQMGCRGPGCDRCSDSPGCCRERPPRSQGLHKDSRWEVMAFIWFQCLWKASPCLHCPSEFITAFFHRLFKAALVLPFYLPCTPTSNYTPHDRGFLLSSLASSEVLLG